MTLYYLGHPVTLVEEFEDGWCTAQWENGKVYRHWRAQLLEPALEPEVGPTLVDFAPRLAAAQEAALWNRERARRVPALVADLKAKRAEVDALSDELAKWVFPA